MSDPFTHAVIANWEYDNDSKKITVYTTGVPLAGGNPELVDVAFHLMIHKVRRATAYPSEGDRQCRGIVQDFVSFTWDVQAEEVLTQSRGVSSVAWVSTGVVAITLANELNHDGNDVKDIITVSCNGYSS